MDETTNVSLHAEGGHYCTWLEPPSTFEAKNYQTAAAIALAEGQNGMGTPLVNGDGSLMQNKLTHETTDYSSFMGEDPYGSFADMDASDTCTVTITITNGAGDTASIDGGASIETFFGGELTC